MSGLSSQFKINLKDLIKLKKVKNKKENLIKHYLNQ